jgi:AraC-like DNA-binding protein
VLSQKLVSRMCRARNALRDLETEVSVASAARTSALSRSHFIARYRTAFGETPHQTRLRARLDRAKQLLATSELPVTEICLAVGFSSLGSFSHSFRMRCGESPTRYRARLRRAAACGMPAERLAPHCLTLMNAAWSEAAYFSRSAEPGVPLESAG